MSHLQFAAACLLALSSTASAADPPADRGVPAPEETHPTLWFNHAAPVRQVALSADGRWLATQAGRTAILWDAATGKESRRLAVALNDRCNLAFSPDSRTLACLSVMKDDLQAVQIFEVATGKKLRSVAETKRDISTIAFSPDGKQLLTGDMRGFVRRWDANSGKALQELPERGAVHAVAFAPDGKTLAVGSGNTESGKDKDRPFLTLWDMAHNRAAGWQAQRTPVSAVAFSPDGKLLISAARRDGAVRLWEVDSGKEIRSWMYFAWPVAPIPPLVFSPDGGLVAAGPRNGVVRLWDALAGDEIVLPPLLAPDSREAGTSAYARSPAGRVIAARFGGPLAAIQDVTDMVRAARPRAAALKTADLEPLWAALAEEPAAAYPALMRLCGDPAKAVPFIKQRVLALPRPDTRRIAQLLADLESDQFDARRRANDELEKMGEAPRAALERALADKPSLEVQCRVERLLDKLRVPGAEQLRWGRIVLGLEHMPVAEARDLLQTLAQGSAGSRIAGDAKAALERLDKQRR